MASVNKWIGIGNLGRDPETRYMSNGDAVTNISIACSEQYKDKQTGEKKEVTEWVRITFYRQLAEIAGQYLQKGSSVYVEGKLQTRKWTDQQGVERYVTEVIADKLQMLGGAPRQEDGESQQQDRRTADRRPAQESRTASRRSTPSSKAMGDYDPMNDEIPFANPYRGKYALAI